MLLYLFLEKNLFLEAHSFRFNQFFRSLNLADYFWKRTWISMKIYVPHYKDSKFKTKQNKKFPMFNFPFLFSHSPFSLLLVSSESFSIQVEFFSRFYETKRSGGPWRRPPPPHQRRKKKIMFICSTINPH